MDKPANIIYRKNGSVWKNRLLILVIGLLLLGVLLWKTIGDPMAFVFMAILASTPFFILIWIVLVAWNERYQINQVFNHRWADWQLGDKHVWLGKSGIYDEKEGYQSIAGLKSVDVGYVTNPGGQPIPTLMFEFESKGRQYTWRSNYSCPAPTDRGAEAQALAERYKQQYHLGGWWKRLFSR